MKLGYAYSDGTLLCTKCVEDTHDPHGRNEQADEITEEDYTEYTITCNICEDVILEGDNTDNGE